MGRIVINREHQKPGVPFLPSDGQSFDDGVEGFNAIIAQVVGGIILSIGLILLNIAYHVTGTSMELSSKMVIPQHDEVAMLCFTVGVAAFVGGGLLIVMGFRR